MAAARKRRRFHHGDLERSLIDAALRALEARGSGELKIRALARRVGVTHAAAYRHFENREALLAAVAEEGFRRLAAAMARAGEADAAPLDRLERVGAAYVRFAVDHPAHYRVMYGPELADRDAHPGVRDASNQAFALLCAQVAACAELDGRDVAQAAVTCWSLTHGLAMLLIDRQLDDAGAARKQRAVRAALQLLRRGLVAAG